MTTVKSASAGMAAYAASKKFNELFALSRLYQWRRGKMVVDSLLMKPGLVSTGFTGYMP
eukprot:CAMPEP_0202968842 /NCGR_PEP_ID=MMETSP1396-20130829/14313_1 /ASSEMBLY_ACC=CAM_ASM_000872 /TAXON_ID= /ORGANISM="Pseudokeronopsis sp., Strain Brazil" /LENGTH=58 /DNA_ID=CAMNT_0049695635 /DNA_START=552 /DNA_END=724 /DNA_ORIENTATION=-